MQDTGGFRQVHPGMQIFQNILIREQEMGSKGIGLVFRPVPHVEQDKFLKRSAFGKIPVQLVVADLMGKDHGSHRFFQTAV